MGILKNIITITSLAVLIVSAEANTSGYQRFLHEKAIENLQSLEASHMVYNVYENFIVPRICQNSKEIRGGKNKAACKLLGHVNESDFVPVDGDRTGVLYRAKANYTLAPNYKFTGSKPELVAAAPKGYRVSYVGCYKRAKRRADSASECSLFFMIAEGVNNKKAPIIAVKGSSHNEDWKNNLLAGAPILNEITTVFTNLFKELRGSIIGGDGENTPQELHGLSEDLASFFHGLSAKSYRLTFTGHSLGGALAQELAREIFIATRRDLNDRSSGPTIDVITWNGLSYTSMIGRLKKGLKDAADPVLRAGWREEDALKLENFKAVFDGRFLSAVNFHTADDMLTQFINNSIIGRLLRMDGHEHIVHAGADVLLASNRFVGVSSLKDKITGHATVTLLKDALYSSGAVKNKSGALEVVSVEDQIKQLNSRSRSENESARYKSTPQYFMENGYNTEPYNKDGGINFDRGMVFRDVRHHELRAEKYDEMEKTLYRNSKYFGRFLSPALKAPVSTLNSALTLSLY